MPESSSCIGQAHRVRVIHPPRLPISDAPGPIIQRGSARFALVRCRSGLHSSRDSPRPFLL